MLLIGHIPFRPQTSRMCGDQVIVEKYILVSSRMKLPHHEGALAQGTQPLTPGPHSAMSHPEVVQTWHPEHQCLRHGPGFWASSLCLCSEAENDQNRKHCFWQNPTRVWILVCSEVHTLIKEAFCEIWSEFFFFRSQRYPQLIAALPDNNTLIYLYF